MRIRTRLFGMKKYNMERRSITEIASAVEMSPSQVYRIRQGKRRINEQFIIGALTAFPQYKFEDLFYIDKGV